MKNGTEFDDGADGNDGLRKNHLRRGRRIKLSRNASQTIIVYNLRSAH